MCQDQEITGLSEGGCHQGTRVQYATYEVFSFCHLYRATGNKMYGSRYQEDICEIVRKAAEKCDCLQSFFLLHSMGGGEWVGGRS